VEHELSTGFHVDGVIGHKKLSSSGQQWGCCSSGGNGGKNGTFV